MNLRAICAQKHKHTSWKQTFTPLAISTPHLPHWLSVLLIVASYCLVGVVALVPRVTDLGRFVTGDEMQFWMHRSEQFLRAIQTKQFDNTAISTHPGVTTMWLGGASVWLRRWLLARDLLPSLDFPMSLMFFRLPVALVNGLGVLLGYALLRRLLPVATALLAALLWAADPYVVGYSRMLHVDALAGTFITLSLLAACMFWFHQRRWGTLVLSGICAGLALLSKSPALVLLPVIFVTALLALRKGDGKREAGSGKRATGSAAGAPVHSFTRTFIAPLLIWGIIFGLTVFALWPVLWSEPSKAYSKLTTGIEGEGETPHVSGNFFLGEEQAVPGVLYYPVALVLESTPQTLIGLLLVPLAWWRLRKTERRDVTVWAFAVVVFVLALSMFEKKLSRYLVPIAPTIDIVAAVGIMWVPTLFGRLQKQTSAVLLSAMALLSAVNLAFWQPYYITASNQLFGGTATGTHTFLVGIGEGMDQVADWLNQQPDITQVVTASEITDTLQPYMRTGAQISAPDDGKLPKKTGYVVVSVRELQYRHIPPPFDRFYGIELPVHIIKINGVDYFWIYHHDPRTS